MVETGLNRHDLGKLILAACFITDLGTVLALGGLFATYGWLLIVFIAVSAVTVLLLPRLLRLAITQFGHRVSEPEIKLLLVVLFGLGGLATQAGSEAVLPAYVAGLVVAGVFLHDRVLMDRLRSIAFALLTPFFFLRAGTLISAPALISGAGVIAILLLVKLAAKMIGVWPIAAAFKLPRRERTYTTLLMATGLTFGSIAALFGLTHGLINKTQYTELVTVVILSAFVPTLIAQQLFRPAVLDREEEEALGGGGCVGHPPPAVRGQSPVRRRVSRSASGAATACASRPPARCRRRSAARTSRSAPGTGRRRWSAPGSWRSRAAAAPSASTTSTVRSEARPAPTARTCCGRRARAEGGRPEPRTSSAPASP